nr:unnamed protein product [Digitaria exilis]
MASPARITVPFRPAEFPEWLGSVLTSPNCPPSIHLRFSAASICLPTTLPSSSRLPRRTRRPMEPVPRRAPHRPPTHGVKVLFGYLPAHLQLRGTVSAAAGYQPGLLPPPPDGATTRPTAGTAACDLRPPPGAFSACRALATGRARSDRMVQDDEARSDKTKPGNLAGRFSPSPPVRSNRNVHAALATRLHRTSCSLRFFFLFLFGWR